MMSAMKTMMAVVLDATPSMDSSVSADGVSKLNLGISIINYHIMQRQMASKTVEFSVSSFGNGATNNYCNSNDGSCPNVETVCPMGRPSVEDLKRIDAITVGGDDAGESDIADAIHVAFDSLQRVNAGKKYNRIMLIITDGEFYTHDTSRLEAIFREMKDSEMSCYVALLGKKDPSLLSHTVSENSKMLSAMASVTGGAFAILDSVSDSFYFFSGRPGMTSRPMNYKIPFYISPSVKVRCQYWGKVSKTSLPSLKKQSQSYDPDQPDSGVVKRTTSYVNPDDPDQEIPFDEKIKGYRYGSQFVPVTGADEAALKLSSEPLIRLLGFYPQSKLQRYHFMDSTLVLQGDSSSPAATRAIAALSLALTQNKSVALVRFVKRADSDPWLAALIPFPSDGMIGSLIIQRLPCAEDIRDFPFPSLYDKRFGSPNTTTQMAAVSAFVDQITVIPDDIAVFNPAFSSLIGKFLEHIMGDRKAASLQAVIVNPLEGSSEILSRGDSALKRIISEFPLEFVDKKKKKRKIYWSDYEVAATSEDIKIQSISVTEAKEAEPEATLTTASTRPVEDFQADMSTNSKLVQQVALANMAKIIINLVIEGGTPAHYRKAVTCMTALREAAVSTRNPSSFNQFLCEEIKGNFSAGGRHKKFWDELTANPVLPISSAEVDSSILSATEAACFYTAASTVDILASQKATEAVEDDLFDDLE